MVTDDLLRQVRNYAVRPTERGFALWRYRPWDRFNGGWRIIANHVTRDAAVSDLEHRLDLEPKAPTPAPVLIRATVTYTDEDYGGSWDWI